MKELSGNKSNDFVDAIGNAAKQDKLIEEIPPPFPTAQLSADRPTDPTAQARAEAAINPKNFTAHYRRFDLSDEDDVEALEEVNNKILHEGWLMAREEWVHSKEGSSYVIMKYLVAKNKPGA